MLASAGDMSWYVHAEVMRSGPGPPGMPSRPAIPPAGCVVRKSAARKPAAHGVAAEQTPPLVIKARSVFWRVFEAEAHLHGDLVRGVRIGANAAPDLGDLEPVQVAQGLV